VRRRRLVTLSSDFGAAYAAQVKGVLARSLDPARIVELTHDLPAHGIGEAAFLLRAMGVGFPPGTVHLAIVDPGVGGPRRPIAIACADGSRLVGPDNGLLMPLARALGRFSAFEIDAARWATPSRVGTTFDGRDLFAPVAARLAAGGSPARVGRRCTPVDYEVPAPVRRTRGAGGEVLHVDRFGNLVTNVTAEDLTRFRRRTVSVSIAGMRIGGLVSSYASVADGELLAIIGSWDLLEIAAHGANAAQRLAAGRGTSVRIAAE